MKTTQYDEQAAAFLARNGLRVRITLSDTKAANWEPSGHHYRVTISGGHRIVCHRDHRRLTFDFWGSAADAKAVKTPSFRHDYKTGQYVPTLDGVDISPTSFDRERAIEIATAASIRHPSEYDILACISSDAYCPETFEDFCAEYGYEADSIKALQTFRRADRFAKRLRAFFTDAELSELAEIQ